jgi:Family of unknown function (DUF6174)
MKRKQLLSLGLLMALVLALAGCSGGKAKTEDAAKRTALTNAKSKWATKAVTSYEYVFQRSAFSTSDATRKVRIRVENGVTTSITAADSNITPILRVLFENYNTIDKLFIRVDEKIKTVPDKLDIIFDSSYGYLTSLVYDRSTLIADEEETYTISEFKTL